MATVNVIDQLGNGIEVLQSGDCTLLEFLQEHGAYIEGAAVQPYNISVNGKPVKVVNYADVVLGHADAVEVVIRAQEPATLFAVASFLFAAYSYVQVQGLQTDYQKSTPDGASVYNASVRANQLVPHGIIPNVAGSFPSYSRVINTFKRYEDNKEVFYALYLRGIGRYNTAVSHLYISETEFASYSETAEASFFAPGASVATEKAAEVWRATPEIGGSSGSGGLKLENRVGDANFGFLSLTNGNVNSTVYRADFSGATVVVYPDGDTASDAVKVPWVAGDIVKFNVSGNSNNAGFYRIISVADVSPFAATVQRVVTPTAGVYPADDGAWSAFVAETNMGFSGSRSTVQGGRYTNLYEIAPAGADVYALEIDYRYPQGLVEFDDSNDALYKSVTWEYEIERDGLTTTTTTVTDNENTRDEIARTLEIVFPAGSSFARIRFRRITHQADDVKIVDDLEIVRVKAKLDQNDSYEHSSVIAVRIEGTNNLSASAESKISVRGDTRMLPALANLKDHLENDTALSYAASRSLVDWVAYSAWQMYGDKTLQLLNWDNLAAFDAVQVTRGEYLDAEFADETTFLEAVKEILLPWNAKPIFPDGRLTFVRAMAGDEITHVFTPDLMTQGVTLTQTYVSDITGIDVEYMNVDTALLETVECRLPGLTCIKPKRIRATGITSELQAQAYGMRELRKQQLNPDTIKFKTELQAMNAQEYSGICVASEFGGAQYGEVKAVAGSVVTVDQSLTFEAGADHYARLIDPNGDSHFFTVVEVSGEPKQMQLSQPTALSFTPVLNNEDGDEQLENTRFAFGSENSSIIDRCILNKKTYGGWSDQKFMTDVEAFEYVADIHTDDDIYIGV